MKPAKSRGAAVRRAWLPTGRLWGCRLREFQADDQAAAGPVEQVQSAAMGIGHRLDDGEAEAAPVGPRPGAATPEALQHLVFFSVQDAGAAIGHVDQKPPPSGRRLQPDRDIPALPRIFDGVIDKVGHRLVQADRITGDERVFGCLIDIEPDQDIIGDGPGALDDMVQKGGQIRSPPVPAPRCGGSPIAWLSSWLVNWLASTAFRWMRPTDFLRLSR